MNRNLHLEAVPTYLFDLMETLFQTSTMGHRVTVFPDRIAYKEPMRGESSIPLSQVASITPGMWGIQLVTVETAGGRKVRMVVKLSDKERLRDAIVNAQFGHTPVRGSVPNASESKPAHVSTSRPAKDAYESRLRSTLALAVGLLMLVMTLGAAVAGDAIHALAFFVVAMVTLPAAARYLQKQIPVLSRTGARIAVALAALLIAAGIGGNSADNSAMPRAPEAPTPVAPARQRIPAVFDVPPLVGKSVSEVRAILGKPTSVSKRSGPNDRFAYVVYTRDDQDLMVNYDYGSDVVKDIFLAAKNSEGTTDDVQWLMDRGNLSHDSPGYKLELVKALGTPSSYTGVRVLTVAKAEEEQRRAEARKEAEKHTGEARRCAERQVKQMLKAPSTAKFPWIDATVGYNPDKGVYNVVSYVDAQNGFGAMIRTNFACEVSYNLATYDCRAQCVFAE